MINRSRSPHRTWGGALALVSASAAISLPSAAEAESLAWVRHGSASERFRHVGTFSVPDNLLPDEPGTSVTSAEIVDVTRDGRTLLYTDSPNRRLGFIDIRDPARPRPAGVLTLQGEPTSVAIVRQYALVSVNTSADPDGEGPLNEYDAPSGELLVVNLRSRRTVRRIPLAGQPDSVAVSPDGQYAAIVIENERDEDENDGLIPQLPRGLLQVLELSGSASRWRLHSVDLSGLAELAPDDPEPEFVDINQNNRAVVSLQENNHLVIVDLPTRSVVHHFSAGSTTVTGIDGYEEELGPQEAGLVRLEGTVTRRREPDAVAWIDDDTIATANEGDYTDAQGEEGGSRSFTLFHVDGSVEFEAGNRFEHEIVRAGHYPEARSENKGNEPEGLEVGTFAGRQLLFVGAERANVVGVYDVTQAGDPQFVQLLPTGIGPEGIKAIPGRGLLAVSAETDGMDDGFDIRSLVTLYQSEPGAATYPMLLSADEGSSPLPWMAISGLAGDPHDATTVWAVSDAILAQAYLYRIDVATAPARIEARFPVGDADGRLDLEGVAVRPEGGFWLASEGRVEDRPNLLVRTDETGTILDEVALPTALAEQATSSGFEGIAVTGSEAAGDEVVWVAVQRSWSDDPVGHVKLGRYDVASAAWTFATYPVDDVESPNGGWVGLSELTLLPNGTLAVIERDNQLASDARVKRLYVVDPGATRWAPYGEPLPAVRKTLLRDVLSDLAARSISVPDKLEGAALTTDGRLFLATDNDGVDENYGETLFFALDESETPRQCSLRAHGLWTRASARVGSL